MRLSIFQVDAFTSRVFGGNPAAVCPLPRWLPDDTLAAIAAENNLSETAFLVGGDGTYAIRWFTPEVEVDLCGHATLASAHVVMELLEPGRVRVAFHSQSGELSAWRDGARIAMLFPRRRPDPCPAPQLLVDGLRCTPRAVLRSRDYLAVFDTEGEVRALAPDMEALRRLDALGVIVTAPGGPRVDFVSRFFAPQAGVAEDPVTGSAHCTLVPYWSDRIGRRDLHALQVSRRGGELFCVDRGDAVVLSGSVVPYLEGAIEVPG